MPVVMAQQKFMEKYRKLIINIFTFAIGNLSSKIVLFLLVPLYTYKLSTAEFGNIDLVLVKANLLLPIISLCINESVFRFAISPNETRIERKETFTNSVIINSSGLLILVLLYILFDFKKDNNKLFLLIILILQSNQVLIAQFIRAAGKILNYSLNGILKTLVLCLCNVYFLYFKNNGYYGYFYSIIISELFSIILFIISNSVYNNFHFKYFKLKTIKELLSYSLPLIPNTMIWWIINSSNRFFLDYYWEENLVGLYAISIRLSTIITLVTYVFMQSWQISAIEESNHIDRTRFYTTVINNYYKLLITAVSFFLIVIKPFFIVSISKDYFSAIFFVPFLLMSALYSGLSGFLGTSYLVVKQTSRTLFTSIWCGLAGIIFNFLLIPKYGGIGASIANFLSFLFLYIIRKWDTKKIIDIKFENWSIRFDLMLLFIQISIFYIDMQMIIFMSIQIILFIIIILHNYGIIKKYFLMIWNMIFELMKKRRKDAEKKYKKN